VALRALAARGVLLALEGDRPYAPRDSVDTERPQAVTHRETDHGQGRGFTRGWAQWPGCGAQAESWLSVGRAVQPKRDEAVGPRRGVTGAATGLLGDISQETVPAWPCESPRTALLCPGSRPASEGPEAVDEIVAELNSVERAVRSLLGSYAMPSDATWGETWRSPRARPPAP